jgi:hypothetical protein
VVAVASGDLYISQLNVIGAIKLPRADELERRREKEGTGSDVENMQGEQREEI